MDAKVSLYWYTFVSSITEYTSYGARKKKSDGSRSTVKPT
jgi:hypothetical protein